MIACFLCQSIDCQETSSEIQVNILIFTKKASLQLAVGRAAHPLTSERFHHDCMHFDAVSRLCQKSHGHPTVESNTFVSQLAVGLTRRNKAYSATLFVSQMACGLTRRNKAYSATPFLLVNWPVALPEETKEGQQSSLTHIHTHTHTSDLKGLANNSARKILGRCAVRWSVLCARIHASCGLFRSLQGIRPHFIFPKHY